VNEAHAEFHSGLLSTQVLDSVEGRRYRTPSYLIFDEQTRRSGPIATRVKHSYNQRFAWSDGQQQLGSIWGSLYPGAGNVSECIVFGRIVGKNAVNEKPTAHN
jgi:hypothetical protein